MELRDRSTNRRSLNTSWYQLRRGVGYYDRVSLSPVSVVALSLRVSVSWCFFFVSHLPRYSFVCSCGVFVVPSLQMSTVRCRVTCKKKKKLVN